MTSIDESDVTVLTLGLVAVREGSYNIINDYVLEKCKKPGDEGHWAYAPFPDFEAFSRAIIGGTGENKVRDINHDLQLRLTALYLESHENLKKCIQNAADMLEPSPERQLEQDKQMQEARDNIRTTATAIHAAWNVQGVLHMWRAHCQSPRNLCRFSRTLYKEILCAWKRIRDELGEDDAVGVAWLDSWVKRFNEFYSEKKDWIQQHQSWNMIHDVGDADFGYQSIRRWQIEINKFRYRHRSILSISRAITGVKERMLQFRAMIKDTDCHHSWPAGDWHRQVKTQEFRALANQLIDLEFRHRLQEHPTAQSKFLESDRLALIIFKNEMIESFNRLAYSPIQADLIVETWFAEFGLILNYDMICTGYAWSVIKSTSKMETDCFIMNYQDIDSKKDGWECPATLEKISNFQNCLQLFIRKRAKKLRKRNKKVFPKTPQGGATGSESGAGGGAPQGSILEIIEANTLESETANGTVVGITTHSLPKLLDQRTVNRKVTEPDLLDLSESKDPDEVKEGRVERPSEHVLQALVEHREGTQDGLLEEGKLGCRNKTPSTNASNAASAAGTGTFDWFEDVNESGSSTHVAPIPTRIPSTDEIAKLTSVQDLTRKTNATNSLVAAVGTLKPHFVQGSANRAVVEGPAASAEEITRPIGTSIAEPVTRVKSSKGKARLNSVPNATLTNTKNETVQTGVPATSKPLNLPIITDPPPAHATDMVGNDGVFTGYIEPSSGPWIEVTKKKKYAAKHQETTHPNLLSSCLETRRGQAKPGNLKAFTLPPPEKRQTKAKITEQVTNCPQIRYTFPTTHVVQQHNPLASETNSSPESLENHCVIIKSPALVKSQLMAAGMTRRGKTIKAQDTESAKERQHGFKRNVESPDTLDEDKIRSKEAVMPDPGMASPRIESVRSKLLASMIDQAPKNNTLEGEVDPEPKPKTELPTSTDSTIEPSLLSLGDGRSELSGAALDKVDRAGENQGCISQELVDPLQLKSKSGAFQVYSSSSFPVPPQHPAEPPSRKSTTQPHEWQEQGGTAYPEEVVVSAEKRPEVRSWEGDTKSEKGDLAEVAGITLRTLEQRARYGDELSGSCDIVGNPGGERDITTLIRRFNQSKMVAPTLEALLEIPHARVSSRDVNPILPLANEYTWCRGAFTEDTSSEEYVGYALLSREMENTVCDLLEAWYHPKS